MPDALVEVANKALRKLGRDDLNSLTDEGPAADKCNRAIRSVLREVLAAHPWGHAMEWEKLAMLKDAPAFGYKHAFQKPPEAIRIVDIREKTDLRSPQIDYEQAAGGKIYTDADVCYARYIVYSEDLSFAAPDFLNAVACKLAAEISIPLSDTSLHQPMLQEYYLTLDNAKAGDSAAKRVRKPDENLNNPFLTARGYEGPLYEGDDSWQTFK